MFRITVVAVALVVAAVAGQAQVQSHKNDREIDPEKRAAIVRLLEVTNSTEQAEMVISKYREILSQNYSNIPDEWWDEVMADMVSSSFEEMLIPIYDRHMTKEEIEGVVELFETPAGKRYIEVMPAITVESMEVGAQWGQDQMMRIIERIEDEGFKKKS